MNAAPVLLTPGRPAWPSPLWDASSAPLLVHRWLWQRLDVPGCDACRLYRLPGGGWRLAGTALFLEGRRSCTLDYRLDTDPRWRARAARVQGRLPAGDIDLCLRRDALGGWLRDGQPLRLGQDCVDLDFGFSPATNLATLRRLRLAAGRQAQSVALWLDLPALTLKPLVQCYQRTGPRRYAYSAPEAGYAGTLTVDACSAVVDYPGLFQLLK